MKCALRALLLAGALLGIAACSGDKHVRKTIPDTWADGGAIPSDPSHFCLILCNEGNANEGNASEGGCVPFFKACEYTSDDAGPGAVVVDCNAGDKSEDICVD